MSSTRTKKDLPLQEEKRHSVRSGPEGDGEGRNKENEKEILPINYEGGDKVYNRWNLL